MILKLKYFGMVAEVVAKEEDVLDFSKKTVKDLDATLKSKYPKLDVLNYNFAVNQTMVENDKELDNNDEVALLPPFAGG